MSVPEASCRLRALREADGRVRVVVRNASFAVAGSLGLDDGSAVPAALDLLVAALAADLLGVFQREATRDGVRLDEAEMRLDARLGNALAALGVVGEEGYAGLSEVTGTLSVRTGAAEEVIRDVWAKTLARSPVHATLSRSFPLSITLRLFA
jgi:hypothetical protein